MDAIVVDGLEKTYGRGVKALDGIRFSVSEGEVFGLLGPNGAGKSTTVRILATLTRADAGSATVAGHDVAREAGAVRRAIGYVPQASGVDREATGHENLILQGRLQGMRGTDLDRRAASCSRRSGWRQGARARQDLLGRHEADSTSRWAPSTVRTRSSPRRAHHRPRPGGARRCGGARAPCRRRALTILLTTHYLEEADRLARRVAIVSPRRPSSKAHPRAKRRRRDAVTVELDGADTDRAVEIGDASTASTR
jgi:ABC-2 type transport system ATP-binding protein